MIRKLRKCYSRWGNILNRQLSSIIKISNHAFFCSLHLSQLAAFCPLNYRFFFFRTRISFSFLDSSRHLSIRRAMKTMTNRGFPGCACDREIESPPRSSSVPFCNRRIHNRRCTWCGTGWRCSGATTPATRNWDILGLFYDVVPTRVHTVTPFSRYDDPTTAASEWRPNIHFDFHSPYPPLTGCVSESREMPQELLNVSLFSSAY